MIQNLFNPLFYEQKFKVHYKAEVKNHLKLKADFKLCNISEENINHSSSQLYILISFSVTRPYLETFVFVLFVFFTFLITYYIFLINSQSVRFLFLALLSSFMYLIIFDM